MESIIVVGAGPTGSYSALEAAKRGVKTVICEEDDEVGVPSHCTGHIGLEGLRRLDLQLPKEAIENEIKSAIFYSPSGFRFSIRFSSPITCVIDRRAFDQHLLETAARAGVKILRNTRVGSLSIERGSIKGVIIKRDKTERLTSEIVIDAEGVSSNLLKRARLPSLNPRMTVHGVQAEVDNVKSMDLDTIEVFLSNSCFPGLFAWIVPRRDGTAKIGLGTQRSNPHDCLSHFISHNRIARQRLKGSHITSAIYHPISLGGPISKTYHNGLLVVGDAASQVKPTTGGGIVMGLTCARIAGEVAAEAVLTGNTSAEFLSEYERRWRKRIGFEMTVMRHLRLMLNRFSDRKLDKLISLCTQLGLDKSLEGVKDVDLQGSSLIRMAWSPRVLAPLLYLLAASIP